MPDATAHLFADDGSIPNNPALPMLLYPGAVDVSANPSDPAALFEDLFARNGWTGGGWRDGIYSFPHYHIVPRTKCSASPAALLKSASAARPARSSPWRVRRASCRHRKHRRGPPARNPLRAYPRNALGQLWS